VEPVKGSEPVFGTLFGTQETITSLAESSNRFLGSIDVYKYGLWAETTKKNVMKV
jgi:hypothetical protein